MPAKNSLKIYLENSYYHIYNRGVEKRRIFLDGQDFSVFLSYLKEYLSFKDINALTEIINCENSTAKEKDKARNLMSLKNFFGEVDLIAYCLLPNHYHLLIKQKSAESIDHFINAIGTRYTMYFNKKYKRVGSLYQGVYKAVLIDNEQQLMHLSRYIHLNPKLANSKTPFSLPEYIGERNTTWIHPEYVLNYFSTTNPNLSYIYFINEYADDKFIENIKIDEN